MRAVVLAAALCAACKAKSDAPARVDPTPLPHAGSASAGSATTPRPALPAEIAQAPSTEPMTIDDARAALPKIPGTLMIELKQTSDKRQVHATWCIDGTGADDVARQVGHAMADAGYTALSIRGDARKSGVSGDKGAIRMSMIVSASGAESCAAPAHYFASATIFRP